MFDSKLNSLFESSKKPIPPTISTMVTDNPFLKAGLKQSTKATPHGAVKYTTSGSDFVDQFANATNYKTPRSFAQVSADMQKLWSKNPLLALCLTFYLRLITRIVQFFDGSKTTDSQRGQGLKHEGIFRMIWIGINYPDTFWKNIILFISIGSWKDIITMLSYDLQYNNWKGRKLDWDKFGALILAGLENPNTSELLKKYLPQIKAKSQCKTVAAQADTLIAKWICSLLFGDKGGVETGSTYKKYRKLKVGGTAHEWQQLISQGKMLEINFDSIHGRALSQLVSSKFLANNHLEIKYQAWIESKPTAKFTGYVYELFVPLGAGNHMSFSGLKKYQVDTINKQFLQLVEVGKKGLIPGKNGLIVVLDSSGSMTSLCQGTKVSSYSVGKSLALYFSYLLEGKFSMAYLEFSRETVLKFWKGTTPIEQLCNDNSCIIEDTNFLSVADHFGKILKQGIAESEFPTGILCISDGCFNGLTHSKLSNFQALKQRLLAYGFSKEYVDAFKVILWDIPNGHYGAQTAKFEDFADAPGLMHISGLDGAVVAFITGTTAQKDKALPKTSEELFLAAMDQEVLNMLEI